jgi:uncharacterized protein YaaR (DUF327 family)
MDKIDFTAPSLLSPLLHRSSKQETKKAKGDPKSSSARFSSILENHAREAGELGQFKEIAPSEEALTELMDAVHSAGSDLIERPFNEEIIQYKRAVRNFVHYVVENAFSVEKSQTRRRGEITTHVQVQVIDRKLEEMAAAILSGQTKQLDRISKIDEIKGLLVDLTIQGMIRVRDE